MDQKITTTRDRFKTLLTGIQRLILLMAFTAIITGTQSPKAVSFTIGSIGLMVATHYGYRLFLIRHQQNERTSGTVILAGLIGLLILLIGIIWYQST